MKNDTNYKFRISVSDLESLFNHLLDMQYDNIGPSYRDGAIMLDHLSSFNQIAKGFSELSSKGHYELIDNNDESLFQYTTGPMSFKRFLHPEKRKLWTADLNKDGFDIHAEKWPSKMAFWGIRSCDLHAIAVLDEVFLNQTYENSWYKKAKEDLFVISVGCTNPSSSCFCTTMNTGPEPQKDYDFMIVELKDELGYSYAVATGSERAEEIAESLKFSKIEVKETDLAKDLLRKSSGKMVKSFDPEKAAETIANTMDHKHWDEVANRCLSCANCTLVCPTCFCTSTEDFTDITGDHTERWLRWDSCFNGDFSFIHGGKIRGSTKSRYRQWLTHKISNWHGQFGSSGCVGCGRCATWCPVGIDIREEIIALCKT